MAASSKERPIKKVSRKKTAKKVPRRKTAKKTAARKKPARKKAAPKSSAAAGFDKLSGSAKKLMLANLGLYGTVLDELQAQAARASKIINKARSNPSSVNKDLVKRGEVLADQITDLLKRSGAPATRQLKKQIDELRSATEKLRRTIKR